MACLFAGGKQARLGSVQSNLQVGPTSSYFLASTIWAKLSKIINVNYIGGIVKF
jgi:hypothetical protein